MLHYQDIFFDLDGTLTDPGPGITNSVAYALEAAGTAYLAETTEDIAALFLGVTN